MSGAGPTPEQSSSPGEDPVGKLLSAVDTRLPSLSSGDRKELRDLTHAVQERVKVLGDLVQSQSGMIGELNGSNSALRHEIEALHRERSGEGGLRHD